MSWAVSGHPRPTLSWSHSDLSPLDLYTRVKVTESQAVLALGPVTRDMAGVYTCTGKKSQEAAFFDKIPQMSNLIKVDTSFRGQRVQPRASKGQCAAPGPM